MQLKPELLDRIPTSNTINSGSTELETTATGGNEDDENSIKLATDDAEITADENSTDMVSSSKDEDETTTDGDLKSEQNCISGKFIGTKKHKMTPSHQIISKISRKNNTNDKLLS